jgi:hypothetical protein
MARKDALTAFNAHFPYLADSRKLQEHGDALLIPHLLHDTETEYRERAAAASFFLMKAGERQYIIGQLEERFTARYKIIEEFLNVHLKVADLTDNERVWALELLDSLLNPNIYTELSEWFHYIDDVMLSDSALYNYERQDIDFFEEKILRDGRMLRDGKTIFNKTVKVLRDGSFKRNGRYGRSGEYTFPDTNIMRLPLARRSGYRDILEPTVKMPFADIQLGGPLRDGTRLRDGSFPRGWRTAFEEMLPLAFFNAETETLPTSDHCQASVKKPMSDAADILEETALSYKEHGADTESIDEREGLEYSLTPLAEIITEGENFQGLIANNYSEKHINSIKRDGTHPRDGRLQRANLLDTAEMNYKISAAKETAQHRIFRNGMIKRDGSGSRSGFGGESIYENGVAAVMLPVEKEIEEVRDAAFQMAYKNNSGDLFRNTRKRDGTHPRDGSVPRSNCIIDTDAFKHTVSAFQDVAAIDEEFTAGMRNHYYRDGTHLRDGSIPRYGARLLPL